MMENEKYNVLDIAEWITWKNMSIKEGAGDCLSLVKLMNLLYVTKGCFQALCKGDLYDNDVLAYNYGIYIEDVFQKYNNGNIYDIECSEDYLPLNIKEEDLALMDSIYNSFNTFSSHGLMQKIKSSKPWIEANKKGDKKPVDEKDMFAYFRKLYL